MSEVASSRPRKKYTANTKSYSFLPDLEPTKHVTEKEDWMEVLQRGRPNDINSNV